MKKILAIGTAWVLFTATVLICITLPGLLEDSFSKSMSGNLLYTLNSVAYTAGIILMFISLAGIIFFAVCFFSSPERRVETSSACGNYNLETNTADKKNSCPYAQQRERNWWI